MKIEYPGTDQGFRDINQDWGDSYVTLRLVDSKKPLTAYVHQADWSGVHRSEFQLLVYEILPGKNMGGTPTTIQLRNIAGFEVPKQQVFQVRDMPYFFGRKITRQFKRGIHANNSVLRPVLSVSGSDTVKMNGNAVSLWGRVFFPVDKYPSPERALSSLDGKKGAYMYGVCISPELSIMKVSDAVYDFGQQWSYVLCFYDKIIGMIDEGKVIVPQEMAFMAPKISDYMEIKDVA